MDERELRQGYFPVPVSQLVAGRRRAFPLYVYLSLNQHLVLRFPADYEISQSHIDTCRRKGVEYLWCPTANETEWRSYARVEPERVQEPGITVREAPAPAGTGALRTVPGEAPSPAYEWAQKAPEQPSDLTAIPGDPDAFSAERAVVRAAPPEPTPLTRIAARSEESALAIEVLRSRELTVDEKRTILSEISTQLLGCLTAITPQDPQPEATIQAIRRCQVFSDDIIRIAVQSHKMASIYEDIQLISETHIEHSTAVAAFAVIFAMGVGYSEREFLADLAFGAFLHDIGIVTLDPSLHQVPIESHTSEQRSRYAKHVASGLEFLKQNGIEITPAVRTIIEQHHERFDGHGYPKGLQGFQLDELAQIVTLADLLHDLMQGRIDGRTRTPDEALNRIEKMQSSDLFPTWFAPELFSSILQMIRNARARSNSPAVKSGPQPEARDLQAEGGRHG